MIIIIKIFYFSYMNTDIVYILKESLFLDFQMNGYRIFSKNLTISASFERVDQESRRVHTAFLPHHYMWTESKEDNPQRRKRTTTQSRAHK